MTERACMGAQYGADPCDRQGNGGVQVALDGIADAVRELPLRPLSEHILIVRAPGAVDHTGFPNLFFSLLGGGLVESPTRATFSPAKPTGTPRRASSPSEGLPILYTSIIREW